MPDKRLGDYPVNDAPGTRGDIDDQHLKGVRSFLRKGSPIWPQYSRRQRRFYAVALALIIFLGFEGMATLEAGSAQAFKRDLVGQLAFVIPLSLCWLGLGWRGIQTSRQFMALVGTVVFVAALAAAVIGSGIA